MFGFWAAICSNKVGITSNRGLLYYGEKVLGSCTHRPSHARSEFCFKMIILIFAIYYLFLFNKGKRVRATIVHYGVYNWDEVVTR